jgi:Zn finger protein HypA/HybF involved in hydrogenase expression
MHEYGIAKSIIETIERHGISYLPPRVKVILNPAYGISQETLAGVLEIAKKGTRLEKSQFDVVLLDVKFTCTRCGKEFRSKDLIWGSGCDNCGSFELTQPKELASFGLARIEVEGLPNEGLRVEGEGHHEDG